MTPEPGVQVGQRPRVVVDALGQAARLVGDVRQLGLQPSEPVRQRLEARVEPGQCPRLVQGGRDDVPGTGAVRSQGLAERGRPAGDGLAVLGRRQSGGDLVGLAGSQPRRR